MHGYIKNGIVDRVLRFNTFKIEKRTLDCINEIEIVLGRKTEMDFKPKKKRGNISNSIKEKYILNLKPEINLKLHKVDIYTATLASSYNKKLNGGIAFKLTDKNIIEIIRSIFSCLM